MSQHLHLVFGGELKDLSGAIVFEDLGRVDLVGVFASYEAALAAWRGVSQRAVDNAEMRYFIVPLHKLLDPKTGHEARA
ncbi:MAG: DUF4170 domain-containing protein [Alphaproteobacteria bacterium]|nr:DUF4170 domain-containing protein [Alphaproteobacteria bacterium]